MRQWFVWMAVFLSAACSSKSSTSEPAPDPVVECTGLDCPPCASGDQCAAEGDPIGDTCCTLGDNLVKVSFGVGSEVVDLESNGTYVWLCGGFGASVSNISDPATPQFLGTASSRCQRVAVGRELDNGNQVFYLAHHGDSWVQTPFLRTYHVLPDGGIVGVHDIEDPDILFEGLAYHDDHLYVAVHGGGVRVYSTAADGAPVFEEHLEGFTNAWKIAAHGDHLYVADADAGLKVVSIANRTSPTIVQSLETTGLARDVFVHGDRVFVACGGGGVDVFDATGPAALSPIGNIDTLGSAQAVTADDRILAVANWSDVAIYDRRTLALLGTEKLEPNGSFEQNLGITIHGDYLFVGEWEGLHVLEYRPGYVAPDLWTEEQTVQFDADELAARAVLVRNRGPIELVIDDIALSGDSFQVDKTSLRIPPGGADVFEITYAGSNPLGENFVTLHSNDPDYGAGAAIPLITQASARLDVGDTIGAEFGFLDSSGQVENLRGKVIVLAYFALF